MSHDDDFDPYRKWLGIPPHKRPPTYYDLLAIGLNEDDHEVIHTAAEQRRASVEKHRGTGRDQAVAGLMERFDALSLDNTGCFETYDGKPHAY